MPPLCPTPRAVSTSFRCVFYIDCIPCRHYTDGMSRLTKHKFSATVLERTFVDLNDLAARCDLSQGQVIDALMHYGRDKVLKVHEKVQKEHK